MDHLEGNPLEEHTRVMAQFVATYTISMGSGCGSVGRTVASDSRGPRFESSHRQIKQ